MIPLILIGLYATSTAMTLAMCYKLSTALGRFRMKQMATPARTLAELPSVSVCIPARNETHAMTRCLESVIASTYPKLEIIVLDDSSNDNTSFLIKSFAHAGVRFVEGSQLPNGWLGKNHALQELSQVASGQYVLFVDVDTQLEPETISQLVAYVAQEQADMISVLPQRADGLRLSVLLSTLRYYWELLFHIQKAPATASAAWMIRRSVLRDELSGFYLHRLQVQPENQLAARLFKDDRYRFLISTRLLGVNYEKKLSSQYETSIRLLYPRFGGRPLFAAAALLLLMVLWSPVGFLVSGLWFGWTALQVIAAWQLVLYMSLYGLFAFTTRRHYWWVSILLWPVVITQEIVLFIVSLVKYATGTVTWKGRPVQSPKAMRT